MFDNTSKLALVGLLLVTGKQALAAPAPSAADRAGAPSAWDDGNAPAEHTQSHDKRTVDWSWLDGTLDMDKCKKGCYETLAHNPTGGFLFQGYSAILNGSKLGTTPRSMEQACYDGCGQQFGGNGRRSVAGGEAEGRAVKMSAARFAALARRGGSGGGTNLGLVLGNQDWKGYQFAVAVPGSEREPCSYARGTWPHGGEWYDRKMSARFEMSELTEDNWWAYEFRPHEGTVRGRDGKRYGYCLPTSWDTGRAACDQNVGDGAISHGEFTAAYTCWLGQTELFSNPGDLLS